MHFDDYIHFWIEYVYSKEVSLNSKLNALRCAKWVSDFIGNKKLQKITKEDFEKFYQALSKKYALRTVRQTMYLMNRAFQFAFENGYIKQNVHCFQTAHSEMKPARILSDADMRKIYSVIQQHNELAVYKFALLSGISVCECLTLKIKDVNLKERMIHVTEYVKYTPLKDPELHYKMLIIPNKYPREVMLSMQATRVLQSAIQNRVNEDDYVFRTKRGKPITRHAMERLEALIKTESNVIKFSRGIFMRTVYSKMIKLGVNLAALRDQCGITSSRIMLYQKTNTI